MNTILEVEDASFDEVVLAADRPVVVDFYADWCSPCKAMMPTLTDIAREYGDEILIVKVDVDKSEMIKQRYGIQGIPHLAFFVGGEKSESIIGNTSRSNIANAVERLLETRG